MYEGNYFYIPGPPLPANERVPNGLPHLPGVCQHLHGMVWRRSSLLPSSQLSGWDMSAIRPSRRSSVPQFHDHINNQEESIIFTKEEEGEQQLPFPDCLISRTPDGDLTSKAYRKPTATDRFLRFDSHHPLTVKRGLIKCLTTRARKLCSTEESEKAEKRHISNISSVQQLPATFHSKVHPQNNPPPRRSDSGSFR